MTVKRFYALDVIDILLIFLIVIESLQALNISTILNDAYFSFSITNVAFVYE